VVLAAPFASTVAGLAYPLEVVALGGPGLKVSVSVLASAFVDASVALKTPAALVVPETGEKALALPVALSVTAWLPTGLLWASSTVTVSEVVLVPSAVTEVGAAAREDVALAGAPAVKVTLAVFVTAPNVAVTVLLSACVAVRVPVVTPAASVTLLVGETVLPLPLALRPTVWPLTGLPFASFTVTVTVVAVVPSATTDVGEATRVDVEALAGPAT
jgi:hypothetical protein